MEKVGKTMLNFSSSSAMVSGNSSLAENLLLFLYFSVKILTWKYTYSSNRGERGGTRRRQESREVSWLKEEGLT